MQKKSSGSVRIYYPKYSRDVFLKLLRERAAALSGNLPVRHVVLFGSYAEGRHTAASDVDLLVVYDGPRRDDDYRIVWNTFHLPNLQPHIYTTQEYEELRKTRGTIVEVALRKGISIL